MEITRSARGTKVCPRCCDAALGAARARCPAAAPLCSPRFPHLLLTARRARPARSLCCLSPSRRAGGSPAASTRPGKTNPTVRRPPADSTRARGWVSSSQGCCGHPVPSRRGSPQPWLRRSRAASPQFTAVGVRRGTPCAPRAPSGRAKAAGGRGSGGKPRAHLRDAPSLAPPRPGPAAAPPPPLEGAGSAR